MSHDQVSALGPLQRRVPSALQTGAAYHLPKPANIVAKLDANEFPYAMPEELRNKLASALASVALERYPDPNLTEIRSHLSKHIGLPANRFVFGNGSDELISLLVNAFAEPQANASGALRQAAICFPVPTFVYYQLAAVARGVRVVTVPLCENFDLDEAAMISTIERESPAVVFLAMPNNPTGTMWRMQFAVELAARFRDTVIVSDEAYGAYSGMTVVGDLAEHPNLVVMRTLSKVGMAGLRLGYLIAQPEVAAVLEKVRPPYNVSSLDQAAALFCLQHVTNWQQRMVKEILLQRDWLMAQLRALPNVVVFPSEANLLMVRLANATAGWQQLCDRGIVVRNFDNGTVPSLQGCLRITVGTPTENQLLIAALSEILKQ
jgi:histidinol-phosphate aminotransferase